MKSSLLFWICLPFFLLLVSFSARAANYYVSPSGDDANPGTSPQNPWRTSSKVSGFTFSAGDRILFQGGSRFTGGLIFDSGDTATPDDPIQVSSYGTGRALIDAGDGTAFSAYNCSGYLITNLNFIGSGRTTNTGNGISFYNDLPGNVKLDYVHLDNVEISGFGKVGIIIGGANGLSGFRNVIISNAVSHDNGRGGILTYA